MRKLVSIPRASEESSKAKCQLHARGACAVTASSPVRRLRRPTGSQASSKDCRDLGGSKCPITGLLPTTHVSRLVDHRGASRIKDELVLIRTVRVAHGWLTRQEPEVNLEKGSSTLHLLPARTDSLPSEKSSCRARRKVHGWPSTLPWC